MRYVDSDGMDLIKKKHSTSIFYPTKTNCHLLFFTPPFPSGSSPSAYTDTHKSHWSLKK